jgi:hypothetical protein
MGAWGRRGGAFGVAALGGDKLIGLSIDLEELHSASRALEARVDEALVATRSCKAMASASTAGWSMRIRSPPTS